MFARSTQNFRGILWASRYDAVLATFDRELRKFAENLGVE